MKKIFIIIFILVFALSLTACQQNKITVNNDQLKVGYYISENEWSLLEIKENNEYYFDRCMIMSFAPTGKYEIQNNILMLKSMDGKDYYDEYKFNVKQTYLIYQGTDILDKVKSGTKFFYYGTTVPTQNP